MSDDRTPAADRARRTDSVDGTGIHQMIWDYMAHSAETFRTMPPIEFPVISQERAERMLRAMYAEHAIDLAVEESRGATSH